jgi:TP901 family phage tail tape measure protein
MPAVNQLSTELIGKYALDEVFREYQKDLKQAQQVTAQVAKDIGLQWDTVAQRFRVVNAELAKTLQTRPGRFVATEQLAQGAQALIPQLGRLAKPLAEQRVLVNQNIATLQNWEKTAQKVGTNLLFSYNSVGAALQQLGTSLTLGVTLPIVGAATAAIKTFKDFEQGTIAIQRAAQISRDAADQITANFRQIAQQTPITVQELQRAGFAAAQAGVTGTESITNFSKAIVELSKVGGPALKDLDLDNISDTIAQLAIGFGQAGKNFQDVTKITSALLAIADRVPGGLTDVIEAMRRASPVAASFGASLQDVTAVAGTLTAAMIPPARAGTELNAALTKFAINAEKIGQALGTSTKEIRKRMDEDIIGVLVEFLERVSQVGSETQRVALLTQVFGQVGAKAMLPLSQNVELLRDNLTVAREEFDKGTLVSRKFETQANSLGGTITVFTNNIKELAASIGDDLAPIVNVVLKEMVEGIQQAAEGWRNLPPFIKAATLALLTFAAVLGPLLLIIKNVFIVPIAALSTFVAKILQLVLATASLRTAFLGAQGVSAGFGVVLVQIGKTIGTLALRLGVITAAIFIFTQAWNNNWLHIRDVTLSVIKVIGDAISGLLRLLGVRITFPEIKAPELAGGRGGAAATRGQAAKDFETVSKEDVKAAQKTVDAAEEALKAKQDQQRKELRLRDREIRSTEKAFDKEIDILKERVDQQQDLVKTRRDAFDEEASLIQDELSIRERQLRDLQKSAKEARKLLDDLRDARKDEVDAAEGVLELARLNLEAARNQLEKEKVLGKDEFDASFRAASARVDSAQEQVTLAGNTLIKTKRAFDKQINLQGQQVDAAQDLVDSKQEEIQVLRNSLDDRRDLFDKELKILEKELDVRKDALEKIQKNRDKTVDILREERDAIQQRFEDETTILQDRLDAIRKSTDKLKEAAGTIPELPGDSEFGGLINQFKDLGLNMEGLNTSISDTIDSAKKALDFPRLEIAPGSFLDKFGKQIATVVGGALTAAAVIKVVTSVISKLIPKILIPGLGNIPLAKTPLAGAGRAGAAALGVGVVAGATQQTNDLTAALQGALGGAITGFAVAGVPGGAVGALLGLVIGVGPKDLMAQITAIPQFVSTVIFPAVQSAFSSIWENVRTIGGTILGKIGEGMKIALKAAILSNPVLLIASFLVGEFLRHKDTILSIGANILTWIGEKLKAVGDFLGDAASNIVNFIVGGIRNLATPVVNVGKWIIDKIKEGISSVWGTLAPVGSEILRKVTTGLGDVFGRMARIGKNVINGLVAGIKSIWGTISSIASTIWSFISNSPLGRMFWTAVGWGGDLIRGLWRGMSDTWNWVKRNFDGIVKYIKDNPAVKWLLKSPSKLFRSYGQDLMAGLSIGIDESGKNALDALNNVVTQIADTQVSPPDISAINRAALESNQTGANAAIVRNITYNIQPGQMIATKGEVRNFVRMLNDYQRIEEERLSSNEGQ